MPSRACHPICTMQCHAWKNRKAESGPVAFSPHKAESTSFLYHAGQRSQTRPDYLPRVDRVHARNFRYGKLYSISFVCRPRAIRSCVLDCRRTKSFVTLLYALTWPAHASSSAHCVGPSSLICLLKTDNGVAKTRMRPSSK